MQGAWDDMARDTRPILFLDIDGVLNVMGWACPPRFEETFVHDPVYGQLSVKYNPEVIEEIKALHEDGDLRAVWLTTWGSTANTQFGAAVGLPELEVASEPYDTDTYGANWWKFQVAQKWYAEYPDNRFIWVDDDLRVEAEATKWCRTRSFYVLSPQPYHGMTISDTGNIRSYARGKGNY